MSRGEALLVGWTLFVILIAAIALLVAGRR